MILIFIGHIRDYFGKRFFPADFKDLMAHNVRQIRLLIAAVSFGVLG